MSMWDAVVQGIIAFVFVAIGGAILKVLFGRVFKNIDQEIKSMKNQINERVPRETCAIRVESLEDLEERVGNMEKDVVSLQKSYETLEEIRKTLSNIDALRAEFLEKFQRKADFNRELQILGSQLESIYKKIDHLDEKWEKFREDQSRRKE